MAKIQHKQKTFRPEDQKSSRQQDKYEPESEMLSTVVSFIN